MKQSLHASTNYTKAKSQISFYFNNEEEDTIKKRNLHQPPQKQSYVAACRGGGAEDAQKEQIRKETKKKLLSKIERTDYSDLVLLMPMAQIVNLVNTQKNMNLMSGIYNY
ncbi:BEM_HP_G0080030.mRNA.1.CDS.1 [Saccharomyces cerevisiae]|nr:BEM_HP_G0080030.mRNA.1.CDS.1 [Saccharomyces cerevisiae]CAI6991841.1 BEM_HP_G0080030.mRNA.1.CDS.1 [Saccharomyces cerevisiae]